MSIKNKIAFDELDIKCITELPLILDVLASTGNKIKNILNPLNEKLNIIIKDNLPKGGWQLNKKPSSFYPLIDRWNNIKSNLECTYSFLNEYEVVKKKEKKWIDYFRIEIGFYYESESEDYDNKPIIYYGIYKDINKKFRPAYNVKFYDGVKKKLNKYEILFYHPEKDNSKNGEFFEIFIKLTDLKDFNIEKIKSSFEDYKNHLVIPFLKNLK